jgi:hypothetical protein
MTQMHNVELADVREYMALVATTLGLQHADKLLKDHGEGACDPDNLHPRHYPAVVLALKGALDEFERLRKLRQENRWQLSVDHPQFGEATDALNDAWQHARTFATRDAARKYMCSVFEKYDVGATGSGTRQELYAKLNERFSAH